MNVHVCIFSLPNRNIVHKLSPSHRMTDTNHLLNGNVSWLKLLDKDIWLNMGWTDSSVFTFTYCAEIWVGRTLEVAEWLKENLFSYYALDWSSKVLKIWKFSRLKQILTASHDMLVTSSYCLIWIRYEKNTLNFILNNILVLRTTCAFKLPCFLGIFSIFFFIFSIHVHFCFVFSQCLFFFSIWQTKTFF